MCLSRLHSLMFMVQGSMWGFNGRCGENLSESTVFELGMIDT